MDAVDLNFTYSIVGAPVSLTLGNRVEPRDYSYNGVGISMRDSRARLGGPWLEWWLLRSQDEWVGKARPRPGAKRMWLERHGLLLAGIGFGLMLLEASAFVAWRLGFV